jgi:uroporphyrinogen-III synthase
MGTLPLFLISKTPFEGVHYLPIIETRYLAPDITWDAYDALLVTSKEAIEALKRMGDSWRQIPVLCVGEGSAERVREAGGRVMAVADGYGTGLAALVRERYADLRLLYTRPKVVATEFAAALRQEGVAIDEICVYETRCSDLTFDPLPAEAVLLFTSPSGVRCFLQRQPLLPGHRIVAIGETTRAAFPHDRAVSLPRTPSVAALVALGRELAQR